MLSFIGSDRVENAQNLIAVVTFGQQGKCNRTSHDKVLETVCLVSVYKGASHSLYDYTLTSLLPCLPHKPPRSHRHRVGITYANQSVGHQNHYTRKDPVLHAHSFSGLEDKKLTWFWGQRT